MTRIRPPTRRAVAVIAAVLGVGVGQVASGGFDRPNLRGDRSSRRSTARVSPLIARAARRVWSTTSATSSASTRRPSTTNIPSGPCVYGGAEYIQHNPLADNGFDAFIAFVNRFTNAFPDVHIEIVRVFAECDFVVTHGKLTGAEIVFGKHGSKVVDIFSLDRKGRIV